MNDEAAVGRWKARAPLVVALLVAFLVRAPGIFWGHDFPGGFRGHHVDEYTHMAHTRRLINPAVPQPYEPQPYPTGLAAHVAVPVVVFRGATGHMHDTKLPTDRSILLVGRAISVAYGVLSVWIMWLIARRLFPSSRNVADLAAWLGALGGLFVSQSHFFVADVPALFWCLLGSYLLLRDREDSGERPRWLAGAAFAVGAAVGTKLSLHMVVPLGIVTFMGRDRRTRCAVAAAFALAGFALVTALTFPAADILRCFQGNAVTPPDLLDWRDFPRLYGIEIIACVGVPVLAAALVGSVLAVGAARRSGRRRAIDVGVTLLLPLIVYCAIALPKLAPFPRHMIPFFPAIFILAASAICAIPAAGLRRAVAIGAVAWSAALVVDTERVYQREPRTRAMQWLATNVPKGRTVWWPAYNQDLVERGLVRRKFPQDGEPDVLVAEAYRVNHWLSGTGARDSRPKDYRRVFAGQSAEDLAGWQAVFDGATDMREAVRFSEGYVMPEPRLADRLLGNRSRNYLSEVVIFTRP